MILLLIFKFNDLKILIYFDVYMDIIYVLIFIFNNILLIEFGE